MAIVKASMHQLGPFTAALALNSTWFLKKWSLTPMDESLARACKAAVSSQSEVRQSGKANDLHFDKASLHPNTKGVLLVSWALEAF